MPDTTIFQNDETNTMKSLEESKELIELINHDPEKIGSLLSGELTVDADTVAGMREYLNVQEDSVKEMESMIKEKKQKIAAVRKGLEDYLACLLLNEGIEKIEIENGPIISFRQSESIEITGDVPKEYQVVKYTPDKRAIKKAIKEGKPVTGAKLVQKQNIQFK